MSVQLIGLGWLALFSEYTLGTLGEERDRKLRLEINVISKMSTRHRQYSKHGSREEPCFLHWYRIEGTTTVIRLFVFYRAWPDIRSIDPKWEKIRDPLFHLLLQKKIVYTPAHGGQWLTVQEAVFDLLPKDEPKELLQRVLLTANVPVVSLPSHVTDAIICFAGANVKNITPSGTRAKLKQVPSCYQNLDRQEKLLLLQFCLKDRRYDKLCGLKLLPLFNGAFTKFSDQAERIYICSRNHPRELFPGLEHRFLDETLDGDVTGKMKDAADQGKAIILHSSMVLSYREFIYILF